MDKKELNEKIVALSQAELAYYCSVVESLNAQILKHAETDRNFQKDFEVKIVAPENLEKLVIEQFKEHWVFNIEVSALHPDKLWCRRKYFDTDKRSAEFFQAPRE